MSRLERAEDHVEAARKPGQDNDNAVAEALTDLRELCVAIGVSFSLASELSRTKFYYDRVNKGA